MNKFYIILEHIIKFYYSFIYKTKDIFIHETKIPYVAIVLCLTSIVLNSFQYHYNDRYYLQNKIVNFNNENNYNNYRLYNSTDNPNPSNILLLFFDLIGINGFNYSGFGIMTLFFILFTFLFIGLIECRYGHISILVFLTIGYYVQISSQNFKQLICNDIYKPTIDYKTDTPYCCGSVLFCMAIAFCLYTAIPYVSYKSKIAIIVSLIILYISFILTDFFNNSLYVNMNRRICRSIFWHAYFLSIGLFLAIIVEQISNLKYNKMKYN